MIIYLFLDSFANFYSLFLSYPFKDTLFLLVLSYYVKFWFILGYEIIWLVILLVHEAGVLVDWVEKFIYDCVLVHLWILYLLEEPINKSLSFLQIQIFKSFDLFFTSWKNSYS